MKTTIDGSLICSEPTLLQNMEMNSTQIRYQQRFFTSYDLFSHKSPDEAEVLKRFDFFVRIQRIFGFAGKMLDIDFEPQIRHTPTRCKPDHAISSPFPIEIQASPTFRSYSSPICSSNTFNPRYQFNDFCIECSEVDQMRSIAATALDSFQRYHHPCLHYLPVSSELIRYLQLQNFRILSCIEASFLDMICS
ncbi:hypothetical protein MKW98_016182 [Papaver atlanticum]|uniref:Uncharacterized protein n=1 Tax=Papaver atlanticum TaxID=357466 RepID=A0AAD4SGY4_9MAGN|nr:hypothetical protein MKW98_016182 [Papaver atlanticum]